jgi:hypothetical protein
VDAVIETINNTMIVARVPKISNTQSKPFYVGGGGLTWWEYRKYSSGLSA